MSGWFIYWLTRLDVIENFGVALLMLSITALGLTGIVLFIKYVEGGISNSKKVFKLIKKFVLPPLILGVAISMFVPSTEEAAAIYLIPKIVNNEEVSNIPSEALKVLNNKFDAWIEESLGKKEE